MLCGATQDGQVMVERSDRMWSTGEGNGKPLQYSCLENPMNSIFLYRLLQKYWVQWVLAAAAKSLQSCPTLCDPTDSSPPGSPVPGISRQEHWSGLPFPFPMHESEKWKWSRSVVSDPQRPHGLQPSRLLHPWDFPGKSTGVGCHCLLRIKKST